MDSKEALLKRLTDNAVHQNAAHEQEGGAPGGGRSYTYSVRNLCLPQGTQTHSHYVIGETSGYFRENTCGKRSAGSLAFTCEVTIEDPQFGAIPGWIYNSGLAHPPRSYFFSSVEILPEIYSVCEGKPYKVGDPLNYDLLTGFGAKRD